MTFRSETMNVSQTILIVDDDVGILKVLDYILKEAGYRVLHASGAEEGWKAFIRELPNLVITDGRMAERTGIDLLRQIKEHDARTPVIIVTACGNVPQAVEAIKHGAYDCLAKPFDREKLKLTVRKALEYFAVRWDNIALRREPAGEYRSSNIVGKSATMQEVFRLVSRSAPTDSTILIQGETGSGKELIARAIHHASNRASNNFVTVNCAAIPKELLESELFGHLKGAFTGASSDKSGKFELANNGTLFLDEVGEIEPGLQKKLLRALQEREVDRVGSTSPTTVDVRVVAASNRQLSQLVKEGRFRDDLYYRLNVVRISLPPLRERREDIRPLVDHFLRKFGAHDCVVEEGAMKKLLRHAWPGNVRELENTIERALILRETGDRITEKDLMLEEAEVDEPRHASPVASQARKRIPREGIVLGDVEKSLIEEALTTTGGNQAAAARLLGISRQTLRYRVQKHGIHIRE